MLASQGGLLALPCWHVRFGAQHAADGTAHAGMCSSCCCCPASPAIQMGAHRSLHCMLPAVVAAHNPAALRSWTTFLMVLPLLPLTTPRLCRSLWSAA